MGVKTAFVLLIICSTVLYMARGSDVAVATGQDASIRLNFWNGFTGPDGRTMLQIVREFNESHPGIKVSMQRMEWSIYYNKLMVAGVDGRAPEVFVIHASTLPRFVGAGFIEPIGDLFTADGGLPEDDFSSSLLNELRYGGQIVGVPLDIHPQGLFCNAEMLRGAGITDAHGHARPPQNKDDFLRAVHAMKPESGEGHWGFSWSMWRNNFLSFMPQFGGELIDSEGNCVLDSPQNVAALEFMLSLRQSEPLVPAPENNLGWVGFRQKKIAMVLDGVYMLGDLKRLEGLEYIAAQVPQIGPYPGTYGDAHVVCAQTDLDSETRAAALEFIRFISDRGLDWAEAGQVPARRSARDTETFRAMPVQHAFAEQLDHVMFPPRSPAVLELLQQVDFAVEKSLRGRAAPLAALREARINFETFVENAELPMLAGSNE